MSIETALREELMAIPGLNNKVFPLKIVEGTDAPYLIYISSSPNKTKVLGGFTSQEEVSMELNILATTYGELKPLTKLVQNKVESCLFRNIGSEQLLINNITFEDPIEMYEPNLDLYRTLLKITFII